MSRGRRPISEAPSASASAPSTACGPAEGLIALSSFSTACSATHDTVFLSCELSATSSAHLTTHAPASPAHGTLPQRGSRLARVPTCAATRGARFHNPFKAVPPQPFPGDAAAPVA
jgi:hypothetical protein